MGVYSSVYGTTYGSAPSPAITPRPSIGVLGGRAVWLVPRRPGPSNTGVRGDYASLTPSGPVTVTTQGQVIDGLDIAGALVIAADDVTVRNSRVRAITTQGTYTVTWANVSGRPPKGLTIIDSEIDGAGYPGDPDVWPSGWAQSAAIQPGIGHTLTRCNIHGTSDGLKPQNNPAGDPILIEHSWVHGLVVTYSEAGAVSHNDTLQTAGTGVHDLTVRRNTFDGYRPNVADPDDRYASSSLMQWGSFPGNAGVLENILIEENWVDGGAYASRLTSTSVATLSNVVFRRNRYGLRHKFGALLLADQSIDGKFPTIDGDVWDITGTTDFGLAVVAGTPVL